MVAEGDEGFNYGTIKAIGGDGTTALQLSQQREFVNHGSIVASLAGGASGTTVGLAYTSSSWGSTFINYGLVSGTKAIEGYDPYGRPERGNFYNFGRIEGSITLANGDGWFENAGVVVGDVRLGAGTNAWFGSGGEHRGSVAGGDGTDLLIGSAGIDTLSGENGNDYIRGGRGGDRLSGGEGRDVFVYGLAGESTAAAPDKIDGFVSGVDRIDLSALDVQSISLTPDAGFTRLDAVTAAGTLTIRIVGTVSKTDLILARRASIDGTPTADFLVATDGGSVVRAGAGDDVLIGSADADRL
ncbi:MAG: M10 family metallopeptidase C-terminal domain-containing protein, partial [Pseudomonadota bacterium]|nr:M10 family metallopeptidase C-terminal domain-containing protein [Pseudomonadota bacterium]